MSYGTSDEANRPCLGKAGTPMRAQRSMLCERGGCEPENRTSCSMHYNDWIMLHDIEKYCPWSIYGGMLLIESAEIWQSRQLAQQRTP